ncbi:unnamed protein product [Orchesella dallaii]|uniref:Reverse transcriptase zinc-binding domain-containing protein n=1 Tax=Orchesella dallaii TaxID=48710 RepID=A0ABP1RU12_9HEXA
MEQSRYPRICFEALKAENISNPNLTYSWTDQMRNIFDEFGLSFLSLETDISSFLSNCPSLLTKMFDGLRQTDIASVNKSTKYGYYNFLTPELPISAHYLSLKIPHRKAVIIAQARLNKGQFYHNKFSHILDGSICTLCNMQKNETLEHLILECRVFKYRRVKYLMPDIIGEESDKLEQILNVEDEAHANLLADYLISCLEERRFILEQ